MIAYLVWAKGECVDCGNEGQLMDVWEHLEGAMNSVSPDGGKWTLKMESEIAVWTHETGQWWVEKWPAQGALSGT